jgi:hypothetical protein
VWDTFLWENLHIEPKLNCMWNVAHLADCDVNIRAMSTTHLFIIIRLLNALVFKYFGWWRAWWKLFNRAQSIWFLRFYYKQVQFSSVVHLNFFFAMNINAILFNLIFSTFKHNNFNLHMLIVLNSRNKRMCNPSVSAWNVYWWVQQIHMCMWARLCWCQLWNKY